MLFLQQTTKTIIRIEKKLYLSKTNSNDYTHLGHFDFFYRRRVIYNFRSDCRLRADNLKDTWVYFFFKDVYVVPP